MLNTFLKAIKNWVKARINPYRGWAHLLLERLIVQLRQRMLFPWFEVKKTPNLRHIVVRRDGNIGDTIVAIPALQAIRRAYPGATITLMTSSDYWDDAGLAHLPGAHDVLSFFPGLVQNVVTYSLRDMFSQDRMGAIRDRLEVHGPLELFVDLPYSIQFFDAVQRTMLFAKHAGFQHAIGFDLMFPSKAKEDYARKFPADIKKTSEWFLSTLARHGFVSPKEYHVQQKHDTRQYQQLLSNKGLDGETPLIVVNAGAKLAIKCWPSDYFVEIITRMSRVSTCQFVLIGSQSEREMNVKIAAQARSQLPDVRLLNLCGQLSIADSLLLVSGAQGVISNDTGTAHMAGLFQVPVVVPASGQFAPPLWEPIGERYAMVRNPVSCSGCFNDICPTTEQPCLTRLLPEKVYASVERLILPELQPLKPQSAVS